MGLKIARIVPDYLPLWSAYGYFVTFAMLSRAQKQMGNEVTVFCPRSAYEWAPNGVSLVHMGNPAPAYFAFGARVARRLRGYDVIHGHARSALPLLALKTGVPAVIHLHGLPYAVTESRRADIDDLKAFAYYRMLLNRAGHVITYCGDLKNRVVDLFDLDPARVSEVPNGIEPEFFRSRGDLRDELGIGDSPAVLYVGRFSEIKGIFEFLQSIPLILKQVPEAKIIFVGCNSDLPNRLSKLGVRDHCLVIPHVPYAEIAKYYRSADIHVALSKVYGYQKTALESLAAGTPVLSSDFPDGRELVGSAGNFVNPRDPEKISEAVCRSLEDRSLRKRARMKSREILCDYSWLDSARRIQRIYHELLSS